MTTERPITELASRIARHAAALEDGLKTNGGAPGTTATGFSLAAGAPPIVPLPQSLEPTKEELIEELDELRARVLGPMGCFANMILPLPALTAILHTLYAFNVASHVPQSPAGISYADLASRCKLPVDELRRILEAAIAYRIFERAPTPSTDAGPAFACIRHNAVSAAMVVVPGAHDYLGLLMEETMPGAQYAVESLRRFAGTGEPGHAGAVLASHAARLLRQQTAWTDDAAVAPDPRKGLFAHMADDAERVRRFTAAMGLSDHAPAYTCAFFVESLRARWDDPARCPAKVVDIGGSGGELCRALLRRYAGVKRAVVLDLPEVVAGAAARAASEEEGEDKDLGGRLTFAGYNFLEEMVTEEADAYVFRHIFHDWSDKYAVRILQNLVPAMRAGTQLWLSEVVLNELDDRKHVRDQLSRSADLVMLTGFCGKERSRGDWEYIFARADLRFHVHSFEQPHGAHDSVIGVVWKG